MQQVFLQGEGPAALHNKVKPMTIFLSLYHPKSAHVYFSLQQSASIITTHASQTIT